MGINGLWILMTSHVAFLRGGDVFFCRGGHQRTELGPEIAKIFSLTERVFPGFD